MAGSDAPRPALRVEAATGLSPGDRDSQEDAVLCDVPQGGAAGIVVLADGLGGHTGGALASRIAVTTVLQELASHRDTAGRVQGDIPGLLRVAAEAANHAILAQAEDQPDLAGMGTTLLVVLVQDGELYWVSVGDSPLYLVRDGAVRQLNETHSLAAHLDLLVKVGEMAAEDAAQHPGRSCLTSALGAEPIERIDCPDAPLSLAAGDVLLAASDGILTLGPDDISAAVARARGGRAADLAAGLLDDVAAVGSDGQDNVSVAVLRADPVTPSAAGERAPGWLDAVLPGRRSRARTSAAGAVPAFARGSAAGAGPAPGE
jgi:serine/threonine protein phosphatase PrpC